jgi:hypothetical protein
MSQIYLRHSRENPVSKFHVKLEHAKALARGDFSMVPVADLPKARAAYEAMNRYFVSLQKREVAPDNVQDDRFLTSLSVAYANEEYIGQMLLPSMPVQNLSGKYPIYDESNRFEGPDDEMSGRSTPNEIDDGERSEGTYSCKGRSLKNTLDWVTMMNQVAPLDEMVDLTMALADVVAVKREKRIADVLTTSGNYNSANVIAVGASDRFDSAGGGDPIGVMQSMNAALWKGRGPARTFFWCSLEVWNVIARHPQLLDISKHTREGLAQPSAIANYFGWDGVLVSQARRRTSKKGQTATYSRMFGNNMGLTRVAITPSRRNAVFGHTMSWGGVRTRVSFDPDIFTDGGYVAKTSHHEDYKVIANKAGVLVTTPITPF